MRIKKSSIVSIVFLIVGYQAALFVHRASVMAIEAKEMTPDTVYIIEKVVDTAKAGRNEQEAVRKPGRRSGGALFNFDPNTVSKDDLMRLGFTDGQAQSILNYRGKGGRFRRKSDFAKSYVVSDAMFRRLEPYIVIPKIDINTADTSQLVKLPGVGHFYAQKIVEYRKELGGYSYPEQLMDIWRFDQEKYDGLSDLITCSKGEPYPLWELSEDELRMHPYLRSSAHGIILYKSVMPREDWTVEKLIENNAIKPEYADKVRRLYIKEL